MRMPAINVSPLRKVLTYFEHTWQGSSLNTIAKEMKISPDQVQSLLEFWVRKGVIRVEASETPDCTSCGKTNHCPYVINLPRSFELARKEENEDLPLVQLPCDRIS
jgi:DNA-binding transcriptional regulator LsrR (DeoR family)